MEYAVTAEEEPFGILSEFDLEVCRSVQTETDTSICSRVV